MADLSTGADAVGGERFGNCEYNDIKNHFRDTYGEDPCAASGTELDEAQPGMIISNETDDRLYHVILASGCGCSEILQDCVPLSDDKYWGVGDDFDGMTGYDEAINDAWMFGIPVSPKRGLIFCDVADIGGDFSALIPASTHPMVSIVDLDIDSYLSFGYAGDNLPDIWSNRTLNLQYEALAGVNFFAGAAAGENPYVYIYGWETGRGARNYTRFQMSDTNNEFVIEAENNGDHEGITISLTEAGQRFRLRQGGDIMSWYLDGTDAFMRWSDGELEFQTDETNVATTIRIKPNGTSEMSQIGLYDADGIRLLLYTAADRGYIESAGGALGIIKDANQDVLMFENAASGETRELKIYGFRAADARRSLEIGVGVDAADTASFDGVSNFYFDGNIGVGILSPASQLTVGLPGTTPTFPGQYGSFSDIRAGLLVSGEGATPYRSIQISSIHNNATLPNYGLVLVNGPDTTNFDVWGIMHDGPANATGGLHFAYLNGVGSGANIQTVTPVVTFQKSGNVGIGTSTFGTNAVRVRAMLNGTAPTTSPANMFQEWSADVLGVAGKAGPHQRSEEGGMRAWHGGAGTINNFTYQADVADNGTFTLPAITNSAWGFIQAGDNEEYAFFTIDDDGDVTLISNSANVVANADTDGKLCLGILSPEEPLTVKNALGGQKNINLIIWYS